MYPSYPIYPYYSYYNRVRPYYHYYPAYYYQNNLFNSQTSNINQQVYNAGVIAGLTQSAISNNIMY